MARQPIIDKSKSYTFRSYFEMSQDPDEILAEFGYTLKRLTFDLSSEGLLETESEATGKALSTTIAELKAFVERRLPDVRLTTAAARREILISPLILSLMDYAPIQLRIEYSLKVSDQLKGSLDYYLQSQDNLIVIEAKNADLTRGFTQLAVELIALDQWTHSKSPVLYGTVSTGDIWQFGRLKRAEKQIEQDLALYRIPADLEPLVERLLCILLGKASLQPMFN